MPNKGKVTSPRVAREASRVLRDPKQDKASRSTAGSALSQKPPKKKG